MLSEFMLKVRDLHEEIRQVAELLKPQEMKDRMAYLEAKFNHSTWNEIPEEEKYFKRIECIKECITSQFMNLEENYVDFMCDEIYTKFYEE